MRHLTGHGCVEAKGPEAGELFSSGLLHAVTEDILPGVQLQQLNAFQDLWGLLQAIRGVFLRCGRDRNGSLISFSSITDSKLNSNINTELYVRYLRVSFFGCLPVLPLWGTELEPAELLQTLRPRHSILTDCKEGWLPSQSVKHNKSSVITNRAFKRDALLCLPAQAWPKGWGRGRETTSAGWFL